MYYSGRVFSGLLTDEGRGPIMMKLDIVTPYQKEIQKETNYDDIATRIFYDSCFDI